jgi:hypothetical protein
LTHYCINAGAEVPVKALHQKLVVFLVKRACLNIYSLNNRLQKTSWCASVIEHFKITFQNCIEIKQFKLILSAAVCLAAHTRCSLSVYEAHTEWSHARSAWCHARPQRSLLSLRSRPSPRSRSLRRWPHSHLCRLRSRSGWESHDSKANNNEGSPRLQTPATYSGCNALRQLTVHISTNDLHYCKPACLLQWSPSGGRPRSPPPVTAPPRRIVPHHQQQQTALEDQWPASNKLPPHNHAVAKTTLCIHTSPGPAKTPHVQPQPAAATTTQPKPGSGPHYGTEFPQLVTEAQAQT